MYVVQFWSTTIRMAPEYTGLKEPLELGAGYYVMRRTGDFGSYSFEFVDGPYTPKDAEMVAEQMNAPQSISA